MSELDEPIWALYGPQGILEIDVTYDTARKRLDELEVKHGMYVCTAIAVRRSSEYKKENEDGQTTHQN